MTSNSGKTSVVVLQTEYLCSLFPWCICWKPSFKVMVLEMRPLEDSYIRRIKPSQMGIVPLKEVCGCSYIPLTMWGPNEKIPFRKYVITRHQLQDIVLRLQNGEKSSALVYRYLVCGIILQQTKLLTAIIDYQSSQKMFYMVLKMLF